MSGLAALWSDIQETLFPVVALADDESEDAAETDAGAEAGADAEEAGDDNESEAADEDEDDEDEDDEDEDEVKDQLDTLREQFTETSCKPYKHHFDECVERVTAQQQEDDYESWDYKEDCVEEFFHYQHCLDAKIAPILFTKLK